MSRSNQFVAAVMIAIGLLACGCTTSTARSSPSSSSALSNTASAPPPATKTVTVAPLSTQASSGPRTVGCPVPNAEAASYYRGGDLSAPNVQLAYTYLRKSLCPMAAAATVAALYAESGLNPKALGNNTHGDHPLPGMGFGVDLWTGPPNLVKLVTWLHAHHYQDASFTGQLAYLLVDLARTHVNGNSGLTILNKLNTAPYMVVAVEAIRDDYNREGHIVVYEDGSFNPAADPAVPLVMKTANNLLSLYH